VCWIRCITFGAISPGRFENPRVGGGGSAGSSRGMWRNIAVAPGILRRLVTLWVLVNGCAAPPRRFGMLH